MRIWDKVNELIEQRELANKAIKEKGLLICPRCGFADDFMIESSDMCYECSSKERQREYDKEE